MEAKIYKITNQANGWVYIGSTMKEDVHARLLEHFKSSRQGITSNLIYEDMRNQSETDFVIEVIDTCEERHRFIIEEWWTKEAFKTFDCVYNKKTGNALDENTKQRIAEARKNYVQEHPEFYGEEFKRKCARQGERNGMFGKSGANAINGRSVYMLNDNKEVIRVFPSVKEATKFLHTKGHTALGKACRTGEKYKGYYWQKEWTKDWSEEN